MALYEPTCVLRAKALLGECPLWSVEEQRLYWLDIMGQTLNAFDPATGDNEVWSLPSMPGSFVFRESGGVVIALREGIHEFDPKTGTLTKRTDPPYAAGSMRFNDGRSDRQGRYIVGSMPEGAEAEAAGLRGCFYRYEDGELTRIIPSCHHANGTAFSLDGKTMFRAETYDKTIFAYDYDIATGEPTNERVFAQVPDSLGRPDGAVIDSEGGYWSALPIGPNGGSIARFTPDGVLDRVIELPVISCTMPAFGGPDMSTIYVTSGSLEHMVGQPTTPVSGGIFAIETVYRGLPEVKFRG